MLDDDEIVVLSVVELDDDELGVAVVLVSETDKFLESLVVDDEDELEGVVEDNDDVVESPDTDDETNKVVEAEISDALDDDELGDVLVVTSVVDEATLDEASVLLL